MGRIRTIKPEILLDRKAAKLPDDAWRMWVSMWVIADDLGRLPCDPAMLGGTVFWGKPDPFDAASRALASLRESSMVEFYEVNGEPYAQIRGWRKHQKIDRPSGPKFPSPPEVLGPQLRMLLANPREDSRGLEPDHDRDHDHDREEDPGVTAENENKTDPDEPERVPDVEVLAAGSVVSPLPERDRPRNVENGANGGRRARPPKPDYEPPAEALTLAVLLMEAITRNSPTSRTATMPERKREHTTNQWAATIDKLHRLDGQTWGAIEAMISWCQRDSFWRGVILGADNLRDKWDKMLAQKQRQPERRGHEPSRVALEEIERLQKLEQEQEK